MDILNLTSIGVGVLTTIIVQGIKYLKSIPINGGQYKKIRGLSAVLVTIGTFGTAFASGELSDASIAEYGKTTAEAVVALVFAHFTYKATFNKPE